MRVFVALDIPEEVRAALGALVAQLKGVCRGARWARVEGLHVTLKFIGQASEDQVKRMQAALEGIRATAPAQMTFAGAGFFPNARSPRVFWTGIEGSPVLAWLATEVERRLEPLGVERETRPFRPHLTLARFNAPGDAAGLPEALQKLGPLHFGSLQTSTFHLYQSHLERGGARYERLATFPFVVSAG